MYLLLLGILHQSLN
ncbi:hypothetical protein ACSQ67_017491 [Phaseolus vulgaris]